MTFCNFDLLKGGKCGQKESRVKIKEMTNEEGKEEWGVLNTKNKQFSPFVQNLKKQNKNQSFSPEHSTFFFVNLFI